ncbi:MAG: hypothetical protein ABR974_05075 [Bacteroidales bacterium]|jgi:hypothetical protein
MKEAVSNIKNDKPFSLFVFTYGPKEDYKQFEYPSLNLELVLAKVKKHIKKYVSETELQEILQGLVRLNCDMKVEREHFKVYVFELSAKDLYKPRRITED